MRDVPDLARKVSLALSGGRGIRLSSEELDLWVTTGANDCLQEAASRYLKDQCLRRSTAAQSVQVSTRALPEAERETGAEALERARRALSGRRKASEDRES